MTTPASPGLLRVPAASHVAALLSNNFERPAPAGPAPAATSLAGGTTPRPHRCTKRMSSKSQTCVEKRLSKTRCRRMSCAQTALLCATPPPMESDNGCDNPHVPPPVTSAPTVRCKRCELGTSPMPTHRKATDAGRRFIDRLRIAIDCRLQGLWVRLEARLPAEPSRGGGESIVEPPDDSPRLMKGCFPEAMLSWTSGSSDTC